MFHSDRLCETKKKPKKKTNQLQQKCELKQKKLFILSYFFFFPLHFWNKCQNEFKSTLSKAITGLEYFRLQVSKWKFLWVNLVAGGDLWIHSQWLQGDYLLLPLLGSWVSLFVHVKDDTPYGAKHFQTFTHFQSLMLLMGTSPQSRPEGPPDVAPRRGCEKDFLSKNMGLCKLMSNPSEASLLDGKWELFCQQH